MTGRRHQFRPSIRTLAARVLTAALVSGSLPSAASAQTPASGTIAIEQPWSRATPPGAKTGAGYLTLVNTGSEADRLVSVSSPVADRVEVHEMSIVDGVMNMRAMDGGIEVPAGGETKLAPGGYHLMIMGLRAPFKQGETVPLTLTFEKAGAIEAELAVGSIGAKEPTTAADGASHGAAHSH